MKKSYLNYLLIIIGIVLIIMNIYENQFQINKDNIWRIISALGFITLGILNIRHQKKKDPKF